MTPTRFTAPLTEDYKSFVDPFLPIIDEVLLEPLYLWQRDLLRRVFELDDNGNLRYRSVLISIPRQQGKSVLGSVIGLIGLLHKQESLTVSVATSVDQATIIYNKVLNIINANKDLSKVFKTTGTRGITGRDGSRYIVRAPKSNILQGLAVDFAIIDEAHLLKMETYTALLNGAGSRPNTCIFTITTAGDDNSEMLKELYTYAEKAIAGDPDFKHFGAFIWEAPEAQVPDSNKLLKEYLMKCNPTLAEGHIDIDIFISDLKTQPPSDVVRYRLNRFVSSQNSFISFDMWHRCLKPNDYHFPTTKPVFAIDRSPSWNYATIAVATKDEEGTIHTEIVASIVNPSTEQLLRICLELSKHNPLAFVLDNYTLDALAKELKKRGKKVKEMNFADVKNASSLFYAKIARRSLIHAGDQLLSKQIPFAVTKSHGEGFKISRKDSSCEIDSVIATSYAVFAADTLKEVPLQIF